MVVERETWVCDGLRIRFEGEDDPELREYLQSVCVGMNCVEGEDDPKVEYFIEIGTNQQGEIQ